MNLVVGFHERFPTPSDRICRSAFTVDGGITWTLGGPVTQGGNVCSDPALAADAKGKFYFAFLDLNFSRTALVKETISVARSADSGRTFPTFAVAVTASSGSFVVKEYIAVDSNPNSPLRGSIYVSYTDFQGDSSQIKTVASKDGGLTWSNPKEVSRVALPPNEVQGSLPVVAPDGSVFIFYADIGSGSMAIAFSKSTDGGRSWSSPADAASNLPSPGFFLLKNSDPLFGVDPSVGLFSNSFPTAAITPDGTIYVAWVDFPKGFCFNTSPVVPACVNSDIRLAVSRNGGRGWTAPVKVSDDAGTTDQFFPWTLPIPTAS